MALTASKQLLVRATARRLHTYQATVIDKTTERTVAYVGVFIPIEAHYLVVEGGRKVKVDKTAFRAIRIGESVTSQITATAHIAWKPYTSARNQPLGNKRLGNHLY